MAKNLKKLLSLVLAMIMVLSMIPAVFATEETTEPEATEPAVTEPAATEPVATEPAATEPADPDAIAIGTADEWHYWFMRSTNNLIKEYSNKDEVAKFVLTADITTTPNDLYYFGTTKGNTVKAEIDLDGHTLTATGSSTARLFGIYDSSELTIKNGTIVLNKPFGAVNGGMFLINKGTLNLDNMVIDDIGEHKFNYNGKLMLIGAGNTVTMTNTTIRSNTKANTSQYNASGALSYGIGAMIMINGTLVAENCNFIASTETNATDNNGLTYYGGMIAHQSGTNATYTNCTFEGGYARYGGALAIRAGTTTISGCTFKNNKAINGGAIYVIGNSTNATITDTTFENTSAVSFSGSTFGGALSVEGGKATVKGCEFKNNTSSYGGAIHVGLTAITADKVTNGEYIGALKLEDSTITGAVATARGGGIHVYNANSTKQTLEMINTDIVGCTSPMGGGITFFGCSNSVLTGGTISNCSSTGAKEYGGGMYVVNNGYAANSNNVTVNGTTFDGNSAPQAGNVYIGNKVNMRPNFVDFNNVTMKNGVATCPSGVDGYSGNIFIAGVDLVQKNSTTQEETVYHCTVNMTGCTIENGQSKHGGNIGVAGVTTLNITDSVVRNGKAATGGGNIYTGNPNVVINIYNTQVYGGTASNGGNIRVGTGRINFFGGSILGGDAVGIGKSLYVNGNTSSELYIYGGTIDVSTIEKQAFAVATHATNGTGTLAIMNANVIGADPTAYAPAAETVVTATGENAYTVKHQAVAGATTKEGTCEEAGTLTIVCPTCEHTYVYENFEGHALIIDRAVAPTCTETGLTEGQHCALCDYAVAQETVPAAGHKEVETKENEVAATCTTDGSYEKVVKCEICGIEISRETMTVPAGHTEKVVEGKAPTCTEDGLTDGKVCEICGETLLAQEPIPAAHTWDAGVYTDPTTEADGYTTFTCTVCGETRTETDEGSKLPEIIPAAITKQPESVTAESGETVQFHVEAQGEVVSYKWEYRKISKWYNTSMTGYNTDTLTVAVTGARNGYDYRCIITFADGTVLTSAYGELTAITYITGVQNPNDQIVVNGFKGQFTASAEGEGLKYRWYFQRPEGTIWSETAMEGCEKPTVYIESTAARNGYKYKCRITDVTGNVVYTEVATMHVLSFKAHPQGPFAATGSNAIFTVETSVTDGFTYQWQYRRNANAEWTNTTMTGYNTATLTVGATLARNGYEYRCVLTGSKSSKIESRPAALRVGDAVVINAQTGNQTVAAADNAVFTVDATNVYSYQWMYSKTSGNVWAKTSAEGNQTNTLTVAAKGKNGYWYRCDMKGLDGNMYYTEVAVLTVQ